MKLLIVNKKDLVSYEQLYNIHNFGKLVEFSKREVESINQEDCYLFIVEELIEIDDNTVTPVLNSFDTFVCSTPVGSFLTSLNNKLETGKKIDLFSMVSIMTSFSLQKTIRGKGFKLPTKLVNMLQNSILEGKIRILLSARDSGIPDEVTDSILETLIESGNIDRKTTNIYKKIRDIIDIAEEEQK